MERSIIPDKWKVLSGSALKTIALVCMIIDHLAAYLPGRFSEVLFTVGSRTITANRVMRWIGRIAFPIYCFLLVEGLFHTRDRKKYALRLLAFAFISEIPWNLVHSMKLTYSGQNVFFTLFLGCLALILYEQFSGDRIKQAICLLGLMVVSLILSADYGITGYCMIILMYALRENRLLQAVVGCSVLSSTWIAGLAFIPINLYSGERGFIKGKVLQYAFYAIYPVHLLVLYFIR